MHQQNIPPLSSWLFLVSAGGILFNDFTGQAESVVYTGLAYITWGGAALAARDVFHWIQAMRGGRTLGR